MVKTVSIGDKIDLTKIEESLNIDKDQAKAKTYGSKVLDYIGEQGLEITMPIYEGRVIPLIVGDKYKACFYTSKGLMQCNVLVVNRYKRGQLFIMEVAIISGFKKVQRREYYRMSCRINVEYRVVTQEEIDAIVEDERIIPIWTPGTIIDLSGGGMRILSKIKEEKNSKLQVRFSFPHDVSGDVFTFYGILRRSVEYENKNDLTDLRLEFTDLEDIARERLIKCIFEEERRKLSNTKN